MRTSLAALVVALSVLALTATAGASAPAKKKPPVTLDGDVNNKGVGKARADTELEADSFSFDKTFLKGKAGSTVNVTIKNVSDVNHTFTIDDQDIDEELEPGKSATVEVKIPANGTIANFSCRFHVSSGMQGAFFSTKGATAKGSKSSDGGYGY
ncbi:MAG: cupredoxin domain-containing protein [Acidimicrobiia bacterium]